MVATPSVAISRLQLACYVEPFANEAKVVGLIPGPWLQKPTVFTNVCHWIWGEECVQRKKLVSAPGNPSILWHRKYVVFFFSLCLAICFWCQTLSDRRCQSLQTWRRSEILKLGVQGYWPLEDMGYFSTITCLHCYRWWQYLQWGMDGNLRYLFPQ